MPFVLKGQFHELSKHIDERQKNGRPMSSKRDRIKCWADQVIDGWRIETDKLCLEERPMNEVFNSLPALFDMFNILISPTDKTGRQIVYSPPLRTNVYNSLADLSMSRCPMESTLQAGIP